MTKWPGRFLTSRTNSLNWQSDVVKLPGMTDRCNCWMNLRADLGQLENCMTGKSVQRTDLSDALWHAGESLRERKSSWRILKTHTHRWMRNMMWHPPVQPVRR